MSFNNSLRTHLAGAQDSRALDLGVIRFTGDVHRVIQGLNVEGPRPSGIKSVEDRTDLASAALDSDLHKDADVFVLTPGGWFPGSRGLFTGTRSSEAGIRERKAQAQAQVRMVKGSQNDRVTQAAILQWLDQNGYEVSLDTLQHAGLAIPSRAKRDLQASLDGLLEAGKVTRRLRSGVKELPWQKQVPIRYYVYSRVLGS